MPCCIVRTHSAILHVDAARERRETLSQNLQEQEEEGEMEGGGRRVGHKSGGERASLSLLTANFWRGREEKASSSQFPFQKNLGREKEDGGEDGRGGFCGQP